MRWLYRNIASFFHLVWYRFGTRDSRTGASGAEAIESGMASSPATCEEIFSKRKVTSKVIYYLGLDLPETGASGPETGESGTAWSPTLGCR